MGVHSAGQHEHSLCVYGLTSSHGAAKLGDLTIFNPNVDHGCAAAGSDGAVFDNQVHSHHYRSSSPQGSRRRNLGSFDSGGLVIWVDVDS